MIKCEMHFAFEDSRLSLAAYGGQAAFDRRERLSQARLNVFLLQLCRSKNDFIFLRNFDNEGY